MAEALYRPTDGVIVVIMPDGWNWGRLETPVATVPDELLIEFQENGSVEYVIPLGD